MKISPSFFSLTCRFEEPTRSDFSQMRSVIFFSKLFLRNIFIDPGRRDDTFLLFFLSDPRRRGDKRRRRNLPMSRLPSRQALLEVATEKRSPERVCLFEDLFPLFMHSYDRRIASSPLARPSAAE